jgi:hypothetical protein
VERKTSGEEENFILSPTAEGVVLHGLWLKSENFRFKSNEERVGLESEISDLR